MGHSLAKGAIERASVSPMAFRLTLTLQLVLPAILVDADRPNAVPLHGCRYTTAANSAALLFAGCPSVSRSRGERQKLYYENFCGDRG